MAGSYRLRSSLGFITACTLLLASYVGTASASDHTVKFTIYLESSHAYSPMIAILPAPPEVVSKRQGAAVPLIDVCDPAMKAAVFAELNLRADERHYRRLRYESS